jgi:hypothetical protein
MTISQLIPLKEQPSPQRVSENRPSVDTGPAFKEPEIKHLELVQSVISRMAQNSFQLKGWSITVATAIAAFAAKESSPGLAILALFPAISFWCLDAYYLRRERLYRRLHEAITDPLKIVRPFSMTTDEYASSVASWRETLFAKTILPLHGAVVLVIVAEILAFLITLLIATFKG